METIYLEYVICFRDAGGEGRFTYDLPSRTGLGMDWGIPGASEDALKRSMQNCDQLTGLTAAEQNYQQPTEDASLVDRVENCMKALGLAVATAPEMTQWCSAETIDGADWRSLL